MENPELHKRIVDDAVRKAFPTTPSTPEETLMARLDDVTSRVRLFVEEQCKNDGFIRNRKTMTNRVALLYGDELAKFDRHEVLCLLSSFLAGHLLSHIP